MPSLRKRTWPSGKVTWDIRYWLDGKRRIRSLGEAVRRSAEQHYHQLCNDLAVGRLTTTRLSDLSRWAEEYAQKVKNPKTQERELHALVAFIRILGDISISDLTPARIEINKTERLKMVKPGTVNAEVRVLNTALKQAVELGHLNAEAGRHFPGIKRPEPAPPNCLNDFEVQLLLATEGTEFRDFLLLLLNTGLRRS